MMYMNMHQLHAGFNGVINTRQSVNKTCFFYLYVTDYGCIEARQRSLMLSQL